MPRLTTSQFSVEKSVNLGDPQLSMYQFQVIYVSSLRVRPKILSDFSCSKTPVPVTKQGLLKAGLLIFKKFFDTGLYPDQGKKRGLNQIALALLIVQLPGKQALQTTTPDRDALSHVACLYMVNQNYA